MTKAQTTFVVTSWLFIIFAALLFLIPSDFPSVQGAAWTSLGAGLASHLALFAAIIYDQAAPAADAPSTDG